MHLFEETFFFAQDDFCFEKKGHYSLLLLRPDSSFEAHKVPPPPEEPEPTDFNPFDLIRTDRGRKVIDMHHEHESAREKRDKAKVNSKLKETIDKKLKESQQDCFVDLRRGRGVRVGVGDYTNVRRSGLGCIKADFCN